MNLHGVEWPLTQRAEARIGRVFRIANFLVDQRVALRSEEHTSELQSLMRISYAVFCLKKTATTEIYTYGHTLSLHDSLPISPDRVGVQTCSVESFERVAIRIGDTTLRIDPQADGG